MKTRTCFVSNSSSSSFVASLSKLSTEEVEMILEYQNSKENTDGWTISKNDELGLLEGFTTMDNGGFGQWAKEKGFNKIRFDCDG